MILIGLYSYSSLWGFPLCNILDSTSSLPFPAAHHNLVLDVSLTLFIYTYVVFVAEAVYEAAVDCLTVRHSDALLEPVLCPTLLSSLSSSSPLLFAKTIRDTALRFPVIILSTSSLSKKVSFIMKFRPNIRQYLYFQKDHGTYMIFTLSFFEIPIHDLPNNVLSHTS